MKATLPARVLPEHGTEFQAEVANLSTSSLFLVTHQKLKFRQSLTVRMDEISLDGVVAFISGDPAGAVLAFRPSDEALRGIEELMDEVVILEGAGDPASTQTWDVDNAAAYSDPDDPTNTEGEPVIVEDSDDNHAPVHVEEHHYGAEAEIREAFARSGRFPQRFDTEVTPNEGLQLTRRAAEVDDVESTISPTTPPLAEPAGTPVLSTANLFRARTVVGTEPNEPKTDPSLRALTDPPTPEGATVDVIAPEPVAATGASSEAPTHDEPMATG